MATLIGEIPNTATSSKDISENWPHTEIVKRRVKVRVQALAGERESDVLNAAGMPRKFDPYTWDSDVDFTCRLIHGSAREAESENRIWEVDLEYSNTASELDELDKPPWERTPKWRWASENEDKLLARDPVTGDPIANSAGDPFHVVQPVAIPVLTIDRYELSFDADTILDYKNRVNADEFWGAQPKAAWLAEIADDPENVEGYELRKTEYVIKFAVGDFSSCGWQLEILDHGPHYLVLNSTTGELEKVPFEDKQGNPTTGNLDGNGNPNRFDEPVFVTYNRFPLATFGDL